MTTSPPAVGNTRSTGRAGRRGKSSGPQPYDFRRPTKLSREHVRALQIVYETFARRYTTLLTSTLRAVSQVTLVSIQQQSYDEYIRSLSTPTLLALITLEPLPGTALLEFSLAIAMTSLDHLLGGAGTAEQPQRPLTDIETPLLRGLLTRVLGELQFSLEGLVAVQPRLGPLEYNPQFVQVCAASDAVVVASFEMKVGAEDCLASFCIPLAGIFPILNENPLVAVADAERIARQIAQYNVAATLENTPIDVSVRFGAIRMRSNDLVALRPGDVIQLEHPVSAPLDVIAAGITFAHVVPGNQGTRLACLVVPAPKEATRP